ncbi:hypothetical protein [Rhodococcus globerulus]|uniref:Uncharacterized protein n=1 Tax=Rhodococcus globerulus TaxID=33008 RepID=A0ABU4BM04_RHOGO|nr:hypothetical protein [Rhodococcus globerulus]MDV6265274.1 hypothetical protein [Rhodococcus globerulus]
MTAIDIPFAHSGDVASGSSTVNTPEPALGIAAKIFGHPVSEELTVDIG